jgi:hypothetical protein
MTTTYSLSQCPRKIRELTGTRVSYAKLWRAVQHGDFTPSGRTECGRSYVIRESDLPALIAAIGLPLPSDAA